MSFSAVPDLQNGVRHPATIATRRPFPPGITFSSRDPHAEAGTIRTKPTTGSAGRPRHCVSMETEFSHRARAAALQSMAAEPVDLLVVGGGITGAGIARDAALVASARPWWTKATSAVGRPPTPRAWCTGD